MSIEMIKKLITPPPFPSELGTVEEWMEFERRLGLALPDDYREFVFAYGSGLFAGFYGIFNPFSSNRNLNFESMSSVVCGYNSESRLEFPERFPFAYHPLRPGLLPWGKDENGNDYFWLTEGTASEWKTVQDENRGNGITVFEMSMTEFLVGILRGEVEPLAGGYPSAEDLVFQSWSEKH